MARGELFIVLVLHLLIACLSISSTESQRNPICTVYDPFKVSPDNAKFQIGGPFPLHTEDCIKVRPETVQELVAIQWALTHWNQNPNNEDFKLAMHAGDTCSRTKESVSQAVKFLEASHFYEPSECDDGFSSVSTATLLGMIAPRDQSASEVIGNMVKPNPIPLVAYTTPSIDGLARKQLLSMVSTAPTLHNYIQAASHLLSHLQSNLISIVASDRFLSIVSLNYAKESLKKSGIVIKEISYLSDPNLNSILSEPKSKIVLCFLDKEELTELFAATNAREIQKLFVSMPINGEKLNPLDVTNILPTPSDANLIILQERIAELPEFREYFLHILRNNYQSYSLLAAYMQQVYNCSLIGTPGFVSCQDLSEGYMTARFEQASGIESAILATYSLAALGKEIATNPEAAADCKTHGPKCVKRSAQIFQRLNYEFEDYDPEQLTRFRLKFSADSETGVFVVNGLQIEGTQVVHKAGSGLGLHKVLEYQTGSHPRVLEANFQWSNGIPIKSQCTSLIPECHQCSSYVMADSSTYSLSVPRDYDLYLVGIFDLHGGPGCQSSIENQNRISLPMAFVHTIWTVKHRYPQLNILPGVNIGSIVVDSCSSVSKSIGTVLETTEKCILLQYPGLNVTVTPQNVLGYVSGAEDAPGAALRHLFRDDDHSARQPLVSLDRNAGAPFRDFSLLPTYDAQAMALLKLLKNFDWSFVSVILSEFDADSVGALTAFKAVAKTRGICLAETLRLGDFFMDRSQFQPSTRVVLVFATPEDTALYLRYLSGKEELIFVFLGDSHNWKSTEIYRSVEKPKWESRAFGSISLQPKQLIRSEFIDWLESITPDRFPEPWYYRYVEERFGCEIVAQTGRREQGSSTAERICDGTDVLGRKPLDRMTEAGYLTQSLESLIFAVDATYKKLCPEAKGLCDAFLTDGRREIDGILSKIPRSDGFEIYNFRVLENKRTGYSKIGNFSLDQGLKFTEPWVWYNKKGQQLTSIPRSECKPPLCRCELEDDFFLKPLEEPSNPSGVEIFNVPAKSSEQQTRQARLLSVDKMTIKSDDWKSHTWTYIFLAVNSLLLLVAVGVLALISIKLYYRVVKGNQSLGICLLLGIILLYITSYFFIFDPSDTLCKCRYVCHTLAYSICFGVLIAKATQLRNAETIGYNGYISYWNYWLLLFFIVGVQIALNLQWVMVRTPSILHVVDGQDIVVRRCSWSRDEFLLSQAYVALLLLLTLFQALMNRNIKRNYKETKWLLYTGLVCLPIWLTWMVAYGLIPTPFQDTIVVVELICCATVILCFMFGPKIYILLSYEPVLIEYPPGYKFTNEDTEAGPNIDFPGRDDPLQPPAQAAYRAVSPAGSSAASTQSTALSHRSGTSSGEQSPVFQAVVRKKSRSKRIKANASLKRDSSEHSGQKTAMIPGKESSNSDPHSPPFTLTPVHRKNPLYSDPLDIN